MQLRETDQGTHLIEFTGGWLELNLTPMNTRVADGGKMNVGYARMHPDGVLDNSLADLVGITALQLNGCPPVPRILWDNREHQWWTGFDGSFEPRNTVVNAPTISLAEDGTCVEASYYYIANHVRTTVTWLFREDAAHDGRPMWDTTITVENLTGQTLQNYHALFACYHPHDRNYYWDSTAGIQPCGQEAFRASRDSEETARVGAVTAGITARYASDSEFMTSIYAKPVLMSEKQEWFDGDHHVVLVAPDSCSAMVTWMHQARDYQIRPPDGDLPDGASFTARIRHMIAPVEDEQNLIKLWSDFEEELNHA